MSDRASAAPAAAAPAALRPRTARRLLVLLLVWAGLLRVWFAAHDLSDNRFWDERYAVRNLHATLVGGSLRPANVYYQSLSYLPQAALLAAWQAGARRVVGEEYAVFRGRALRPEGYLLCRLSVVAFGLASLLLTFLVGRRLFSPEVGLLGALLLASTPLHLRLSAYFKPDALVTLLVLAAFLASLAAVERASWRRYLGAGLGAGLTMSAKLTGGAAGIPLVAGALLGGWRDRRHGLGLAAAGLAAGGTFLLLNPEIERLRAATRRSLDLYAMRAEDDRAGEFLHGLTTAGKLLATPGCHGRVIGTLARLGLAGLAVAALRRWRERRLLLPRLMLLSFPLGYALLHAATAPDIKANNFLPVLPFTALAAAWLLVAAWHWAGARWPLLARRGVGALAAAGVAAWAALPVHGYAYAARTPSTATAALHQLAADLAPLAGRLVVWEEPPPLAYRGVEECAALHRAGSLAAAPAAALDGADAEVFPAARLHGTDGAFYRRRATAAAAVRHVPPRLLARRGEELVVLLHPSRAVAAEELALAPSPAEADLLVAALPAGPPAARVSLWIEMPRQPGSPQRPELRLGGATVALQGARCGAVDVWTSGRLPAPASPELELRLPPLAGGSGVRLTLYRWRRDGR